RLAIVRLRDREVDEPPEVERRVLHHAALARDDALAQQADRVVVRVGPHVSGREDALYASHLLLVAEQLSHALRALDDREGLLRAAGNVAAGTEIAKADELV